MTLEQKIAEKDKLTAIDSSISSCLEILRQEIIKRADLTEEPMKHLYLSGMAESLETIEYRHKIVMKP